MLNSVPMYSSRGPTFSGTIKPDVVAPGTTIYSAKSRNRSTANDNFVDGSVKLDPRWTFSSGSSMAAPLVAGCAAVLREALANNGCANPTAALLKALIINSAVDLSTLGGWLELGLDPQVNQKQCSGNNGASLAAVPNGVQGFGRGKYLFVPSTA